MLQRTLPNLTVQYLGPQMSPGEHDLVLVLDADVVLPPHARTIQLDDRDRRFADDLHGAH